MAVLLSARSHHTALDGHWLKRFHAKQRGERRVQCVLSICSGCRRWKNALDTLMHSATWCIAAGRILHLVTTLVLMLVLWFSSSGCLFHNIYSIELKDPIRVFFVFALIEFRIGLKVCHSGSSHLVFSTFLCNIKFSYVSGIEWIIKFCLFIYCILFYAFGITQM